MDELGANVRMHRKRLGLTQDKLGAMVKYATGAMIHQIETGQRQPSRQQLSRLAHALGVTVSDLEGDKAPCTVTNHANGAHAIGYQHNEGTGLMTEELQGVFRAIVREELAVFKQEVRELLKEAAREADGEQESQEDGP